LQLEQAIKKGRIKEVFSDIQSQFKAAQKWTYMDISNQSIISNATREAINKYIDDVQYNGESSTNQWFNELESVREKFATLINATPEEIAFTKNVSEGLNIIANAFPWKKGDNVIICKDIEHPNNIYVWYNLEKLGVEVRFVQSNNGVVSLEHFQKKVDQNTRMISISSVSFVPGIRTNLKQLSKFCCKNNIFLLVDAVQSCGIFDLNVKDIPVDAIVTSTAKGLLGLFGFGFLYCKKKWIDKLHPVYLARHSVNLSFSQHQETVGGSDFKLYDTAKRFEIGDINIAGAFAIDASLDLLLSVGVKNIEQHVLKLSGRLTNELQKMGFKISSGKTAENMSNIVTVGEWGSDEHFMTEDPKLTELHYYLLENKIRTSLRRGLVRFSFHLYNTVKEVDDVLNLIEMKFVQK